MDVNNLSIDLTKIPLPTGISIDSSGSPFVRTGFTAQVSAFPAISRILGVQCPTCPSATAPKPAFSAPPATTTVSLAAGSNLQSGTLATGSQISIVLNNGFGFDPLNPPGVATPGTITLTVNSGSTTLGTQVLQGPATTMPTGSSRTVTIPLAGTFTAASGITVTMTMDSPAGSPTSPVTMNANQLFTATPSAIIKISTATVAIAASSMGSSSSSLNLASLDQLANRIEDVPTTQGALLLTVTNPMTIGANATLTFTGTKTEETDGISTSRPMQTITKNVLLPAGGVGITPATVAVNLSGTELRELLGSDVIATFSGSTIAGSTAVTPNSRITTTARMRLRVFVKELK